MKRIACLSVLLLFVLCMSAQAAELALYGAGSLARVMGEMAAEYESLTGNKVKTKQQQNR